ncbi:helix-turn-helix domain-containing protein [Acidobacteriota bacterium]
MEPIGTELKRERELRGITLQEIADSTKINIRYLRDLEEDRLENLLGSFFTKGIIRSYAKYIGLDENTILNGYYESELHREEDPEEEEETPQAKQTLPIKVKRILYSISLFLAIMTVLTILYIIFYEKPQGQQIEETPSTQTIQEPVFTPPPERTVLEEKMEMVLDLTFIEETWIQIKVDGEMVINGLKLEGEKIQLIAKEFFVITCGNAGGITFTLNNKPGILFGGSGTVFNDLMITLENMETFIKQEEENVPI